MVSTLAHIIEKKLYKNSSKVPQLVLKIKKKSFLVMLLYAYDSCNKKLNFLSWNFFFVIFFDFHFISDRKTN